MFVGFQAAGTTYYDSIVGARAYREGEAQDIAGITVDGDRVGFRLVRPSGSFLYALALPFACVVPADALHRQTDLPPPMTGPYMVTARIPGRSLTIDRNPEWEANVAAGMPADPNRYEGWLQYAAMLGNDGASYELALHYRRIGQPVLASKYEARAAELGFVAPRALDHNRK